jgi:hypothetical protein
MFYLKLCLETWLNSSKTCPICRSKVSISERSFGRVHFNSISNTKSPADVDFEPQVAKALQESLLDAKIQELRKENSELKLQLTIKESMSRESILESKLRKTLKENEDLKLQLILMRSRKEHAANDIRKCVEDINRILDKVTQV